MRRGVTTLVGSLHTAVRTFTEHCRFRRDGMEKLELELLRELFDKTLKAQLSNFRKLSIKLFMSNNICWSHNCNVYRVLFEAENKLKDGCGARHELSSVLFTFFG